MSLKVYNSKRKFNKTPEPRGKVSKNKTGPLKFVVQLHAASRLHYDFRIEFDGAYKSWAVPKGPSINPMDQRLAVFVEDHPLEYGSFEGIIPDGNYGAGTVMVWDNGTFVERGSKGRKQSEAALKKGFDKGHMTFVMDGEKLKGEFALIKLKKADPNDKAWLLVKKRDAFAAYKDITKQNLSVKTGRSMEKIAAQAAAAGDIWLSKRKSFDAIPKSEKKTFAVKKSLVKPYMKGEKTKPKLGSSSMPRRIKPLIAAAGKEASKEGGWIFEPYLDGLRAIAEVDGRITHMHSKSLLPFDKKFPQILDELKTISKKMVLDGEIVTKGKTSTYYVYDILYFDDKDLRGSPLSERKKILENAFEDSALVKQQQYKTTALDFPRGTESVAKNLKSLYHSGTSKDWLRISSPQLLPSQKKGAAGSEAKLTHPEKVFFPEEGYTKGDVFHYYEQMMDYILPYLMDRPQSLNRHPNGINNAGFYQKDVTGHIPRWLKTQRVYSESNDKTVDYAVIQNPQSLLYIVNLGCIEINPWFSRIDNLENPDFMVIDLDPDDNPFKHVVEIAQEIHKILEDIGAESFCKTSGATGLHICVPLKAKYDFETVRKFSEDIVTIIAKKHPATTSIVRNPSRRKGKIYLDYMQNRRGQTLAAPYSLRPRKGAPVSTPLKWSELTPDLKPENFHMENTLARIKKVGDLWSSVLGKGIDLERCVRVLKKKYSKD